MYAADTSTLSAGARGREGIDRRSPGAGVVRGADRPRAATLLAAGIVGLAAFAVAAPRAAPAPETSRYVVAADSSRVWFDARATLGDFRGVNRAVDGWGTLPDDAEAVRDGRARYVGASGHVTIAVDSFRTGLGLRDGHLRDAMETERYPDLEFELVRAEEPDAAAPAARARSGGAATDAAARSDLRPIVLRGWLSIKATAREVAIPATIESIGDMLRVRGRLAARLTAYGIEPPSRFFGLAAMEDSIELGFDVRFVPDPAADGAVPDAGGRR